MILGHGQPRFMRPPGFEAQAAWRTDRNIRPPRIVGAGYEQDIPSVSVMAGAALPPLWK